jgi:hypothetical protein
VSSKEWLASFRVGPSQRTNYYVPVLALVVCSMESANPGVDNKIATRTRCVAGVGPGTSGGMERMVDHLVGVSPDGSWTFDPGIGAGWIGVS